MTTPHGGPVGIIPWDGDYGSFGRNLNHDPRSRAFAHRPRTTALVKTMHTRYVPIFDQGKLGSCVPNALLGLLGTGPLYVALRALWSTFPPAIVYTESTARSWYSDITAIDPFPGSWPPDDTGTDGNSAARYAVSRGYASSWTHVFDIDTALATLCETPVIVGLNWYDSMSTPIGGLVGVDATARVIGGHELVFDRIDPLAEEVGFANPWGVRWGDRGRGRMSFALLERLLGEQGDMTVLAPVTAPVIPPEPTPAASPEQILWNVIKDAVHAKYPDLI